MLVNTLSSKYSLILSSTAVPNFVLLSYIQGIIPVISNELFSLFFITSNVCNNLLTPCKAKNSVCTGMNISLATVSAFSVRSPKEGGQSIKT